MLKLKNEYDRMIEKVCERKLLEIFPHGIPLEVRERYRLEYDQMLQCRCSDMFYIYMRIAEASRRVKMPLLLDGVSNDSLLTYLVGNDYVNPLNAYYYCTDCGHYERIEKYWYGVDAPDKDCPNCGRKMKGDGFSLPWRTAWGTHGGRGQVFSYTAPIGFLPVAKACIEEVFSNCIVEELADDILIEDYAWGEVSACIDRNGFVVFQPDISFEVLNNKYRVKLADGTYAYYINPQDEDELGAFRIVFNWKNPADVLKKKQQLLQGKVTVREKVQALCAEDSDIYIEFGKKMSFYSREALYRLLIENGINETLSSQISEFVRKGKRNPLTWETHKDTLEHKNFPKKIINDMSKCRYLCSEGRNIALVQMNFGKKGLGEKGV